MYKCDKCGKVIEKLPEIIDKVPFGDTTADLVSTDEDCACGGTYLEAIKCKVCGNIKHIDDGIAYTEELCHDCLDDLSRNIRMLRDAFEDTEDGNIDELAEFILESVLVEKKSKIVWDFIESECKFSSVRSKIIEYIPDFLDGNYEYFAGRLKERGMVE